MSAFDKKIEKVAAEYGGPFRAWNMSVSTYNNARQIPRMENCFAIMFTNIGDTAATINGMVIFPNATPGAALGDSRSVGGHLMDLYMGNITLAFRPPIGAAPLVEIVQLFYVTPFKKEN